MNGLSKAPGWLRVAMLLALGSATGVTLRFEGLSDSIRVALILVLVVLMTWACAIYWRRMDEVQKEAHKFAWYWGGSVGLGLAAGAMVIVQRVGIGVPASADPADMIALGITLCMLCQIAGYLLVWAGWWLARR